MESARRPIKPATWRNCCPDQELPSAAAPNQKINQTKPGHSTGCRAKANLEKTFAASCINAFGEFWQGLSCFSVPAQGSGWHLCLGQMEAVMAWKQCVEGIPPHTQSEPFWSGLHELDCMVTFQSTDVRPHYIGRRHAYRGIVASPICDCGAPLQTPEHIIETCPRRFIEGGLPKLASLDDDIIVWLCGFTTTLTLLATHAYHPLLLLYPSDKCLQTAHQFRKLI